MANHATVTGTGLHPGPGPHVLTSAGRVRWLRRLWDGPGWVRRLDWLESRIDTLRKTLATHPQAGTPSAAPAWWRVADDLLRAATDALSHRWLDLGWRYVHAAEEAIMESYDEARLGAELQTVREQCQAKLGGWRHEACRKLLDDGAWANADLGGRQKRLREAHMILHEHYADRWLQHDVLRRQLVLVIWFIVIIASALTYFTLQIGDPPDATEQAQGFEDANLLYSIILSGLLGGAMSAFLTFAAPQDSKIPDQLMEHAVTLFRTFFGGAAALAVYFLLGSELADQIFSFDATQYPLVLFVSFAAGFSERLVRKSVEKVAG